MKLQHLLSRSTNLFPFCITTPLDKNCWSGFHYRPEFYNLVRSWYNTARKRKFPCYLVLCAFVVPFACLSAFLCELLLRLGLMHSSMFIWPSKGVELEARDICDVHRYQYSELSVDICGPWAAASTRGLKPPTGSAGSFMKKTLYLFILLCQHP